MNFTLAKLLAYGGALAVIFIGVVVLATVITLFVMFTKAILIGLAIIAGLALFYVLLRNIADRLYSNWLKGKQ